MKQELKRLDALIAKRKSCKLKQREVASLANISERQYRKIEAGGSEPQMGTGLSIAENLGINVEALKKLFIPQTPKAANSGGQTQETK